MQNSYELFSQLKNRNLPEERVLKLLVDVLVDSKSAAKIQLHNQNLLLFSSMNENETLYRVLLKNFPDTFEQEDLCRSISLVYANKSPEILETGLKHLQKEAAQRTGLLNAFSRDCFREENILLVKSWLDQHLSPKEKTEFATELIKHNNTPFLREVSKDSAWYSILVDLDKKKTNQMDEAMFERLEKVVASLRKPVTKAAKQEAESLLVTPVIVKKKRRAASM